MTVTHPPHRVFTRTRGGQTEVAVPLHPKGWLGLKVRRACRKQGGHFWHPTDAMIAWGCCKCGAARDMPQDGR